MATQEIARLEVELKSAKQATKSVRETGKQEFKKANERILEKHSVNLQASGQRY